MGRLQQHPSMLVICGNNENEEALFNNWFDDYMQKGPKAKKSPGKEHLIVYYRKLFIGTFHLFNCYGIRVLFVLVLAETVYPAVLNSLQGPHKLSGILRDSLPFWPSSPSNGIDEW